MQLKWWVCLWTNQSGHIIKLLSWYLGILRGLWGYGVMFPYGVKSDSELICYLDSDWCGDIVYIRSTSWYFFKYLGAPISWCSKKQPIVALLTCEAEYNVGVLSMCQAVWICKIKRSIWACMWGWWLSINQL